MVRGLYRATMVSRPGSLSLRSTRHERPPDPSDRARPPASAAHARRGETLVKPRQAAPSSAALGLGCLIVVAAAAPDDLVRGRRRACAAWIPRRALPASAAG